MIATQVRPQKQGHTLAIALKSLQVAIALANKIIPSTTTHPVLRYALIESQRDGIWLTAQSLQAALRIKLTAEADEHFRALVPVDLLHRNIRDIRNGAITLTLGENSCGLKAGRTEVTLAVAPLLDDFVIFSYASEGAGTTLAPAPLSKSIGVLKRAVQIDSPTIENGIWLNKQGDRLQIAKASNLQFSCTEMEASGEDFPFRAVSPSLFTGLKEIDPKTVVLRRQDDRDTLEHRDDKGRTLAYISARRPEAGKPVTDPLTFNQQGTATINRHWLVKQIEMAEIFQKRWNVRQKGDLILQLTADVFNQSIILQRGWRDLGAMQVEHPADVSRFDQLLFNATDALRILKKIKTTEVVINTTARIGELAMISWQGVGDDITHAQTAFTSKTMAFHKPHCKAYAIAQNPDGSITLTTEGTSHTLRSGQTPDLLWHELLRHLQAETKAIALPIDCIEFLKTAA